MFKTLFLRHQSAPQGAMVIAHHDSERLTHGIWEAAIVVIFDDDDQVIAEHVLGDRELADTVRAAVAALFSPEPKGAVLADEQARAAFFAGAPIRITYMPHSNN